MKIGVDFDETLVATWQVISRRCQKERGFPLPAHVYRYDDWVDPSLTREEYRDLIFRFTPAHEWAAEVEVIPGALEGVRALLACGIEIEILTARGLHEGELDAVTHVLSRYGLNLTVVGAAYQPKKNFVAGYTVMIDDQVRELIDMPLSVHRLLLRRPHNENMWRTVNGGIVPVRDWPHVVETIKALLKV